MVSNDKNQGKKKFSEVKTFDEYFRKQTRHILDSVFEALSRDSRRKFVWAEC